MNNLPVRISFDEFVEDPESFIERVLYSGEVLMIEKGEGEIVSLSPVVNMDSKTKTEADWEAFRAAAGSWDDVDTDAFLKDIKRSSSRLTQAIDG